MHFKPQSILLIAFILFTAFLTTGCSRSEQPVRPTPIPPTQPSAVSIDAGAPLECTLMPTPKQIESTTATYGCEAPGAYLKSVDTADMTAQYFTTDSQGKAVTYGPEEKTILEILPE